MYSSVSMIPYQTYQFTKMRMRLLSLDLLNWKQKTKYCLLFRVPKEISWNAVTSNMCLKGEEEEKTRDNHNEQT